MYYLFMPGKLSIYKLARPQYLRRRGGAAGSHAPAPEMLRHAVYFVMVSSIYASADGIQYVPFENQKHTALPHFIMTSVISNKGRRNLDYKVTDVNEDVQEQNMKNGVLRNIMSSTNNNNHNTEPYHFQRTYRLFDDEVDSVENIRSQNVNEEINPKKLLNEIRNYPPNAFNEDEQRRLFFSQIFSLFGNDELRNPRKTNKEMQRDNDSNKHSDYYNKHSKHQNADWKANPQTSPSDRRHLFGNKAAPDYDASFVSVNKKLARAKEHSHKSDKIMNKNSLNLNPDVVTYKHKRPFERRRPARENNSRISRQLTTDSLTEDSSDNFQKLDEINDLTLKSKKRNKSLTTPSVDEPFTSDSENLLKHSTIISSILSSSEKHVIMSSEEKNEADYVDQTHSFEDVTETTPDNKESIENNYDFLPKDNSLIKYSPKTVKNFVKFTDLDDFPNSYSHLIRDENSVKLNDDNISSKEVNNINDDVSYTVSTSQKKILEVTKDDNDKKEKESKILLENTEKDLKERPEHVDIGNLGTRRSNFDSAKEDTEITKTEEVNNADAESPQQELQLPQVYAHTKVIPIHNEVMRPLSAHIKFDLIIEMPSKNDDANSR